METPPKVQFYPILNNKLLNSATLGSILGTLYASNQKYFTLKQLQALTNLSESEIKSTITQLNKLGDVGILAHENIDDNQFYIDAEGSINQLRNSVAESKKLLHVLENVMEHRDESNEALNAFIRNIIVLYSEVLDFVTFKIEEHFKK